MFTGIVEELGHVVELEPGTDSARLTVRGPLVTSDAAHGASIAVNGVCLTVVEHDDEQFTVDVMAETLSRSSLGRLRAGDRVNLERAMAAASRFGGHIVQGHVDGTAQILARTPGDRWEVVQSQPPGRARPLRRREGLDHRRRRQPHRRPPSTTPTFTVSLIPTTLALPRWDTRGLATPSTSRSMSWRSTSNACIDLQPRRTPHEHLQVGSTRHS